MIMMKIRLSLIVGERGLKQAFRFKKVVIDAVQELAVTGHDQDDCGISIS